MTTDVQVPQLTNATGGRGPEATGRDEYIDNVKGILILLVVASHTIGQTVHTFDPSSGVYRWIYLFHMPAFVLMAGAMTSTRELGGKQVRALVKTVILPYTVFQLAYLLLLFFNGRPVGWGVDAFLTPVYALWFLPALILWRLSTPFLLRIRPALPLAIPGLARRTPFHQPRPRLRSQ